MHSIDFGIKETRAWDPSLPPIIVYQYRLPIIPPLGIYSRIVQVCFATDMYDNVYGNYMDLLCNIVKFSNRQKVETIKMSLNKHEYVKKIN